MTEYLQAAREHADLILLAEMAAFLHDIGKLSPGFVLGKLSDRDLAARFPGGSQPPNLHPVAVLEHDGDRVPQELNHSLGRLLGRRVMPSEEWLAEACPRAFLAEHHSSMGLRPIWVDLLIQADQGDSGDDEHTADDNRQGRQRGEIYRATVFGREEVLEYAALDGARERVWQVLAGALRSGAPWPDRRGEFLEVLEGELSRTLAKTQRAANDVTLYQHSRAVATRFKAFVARRLLGGGDAESAQFRLLTVGWDAWNLVVRVPRLSDAAGRRELIRQFKSDVARLVEVECPLGNVVYEDDGCLVALVANLEAAEELREAIERLARGPDETDTGISAVVRLSPATTAVTDIVGEREAARRESPRPAAPLWEREWHGRSGRAVCPICGQRPLKQADDPHCDWCGRVRARGAASRVTEESGTVWTGEIAGRDGRLAMLVACLSLDRWLDGTQLDTVLITGSLPRAQARGWMAYPRCTLTEALSACVRDPALLSNPTVEPDDLAPDWAGPTLSSAEGEVRSARTFLSGLQAAVDAGKPVDPDRLRAALERLSAAETAAAGAATRHAPALLAHLLQQHKGETHRRLLDMAAALPSGWPLVDRYASVLARKNPSAARLLRVWEGAQRFLREAVPEAVGTILTEDRARPVRRQRYAPLWGGVHRVCFSLGPEAGHLRPGIYAVEVVNRQGERLAIEIFLSWDREKGWEATTIDRPAEAAADWLARCGEACSIEVVARETGRKERHTETLAVHAVTTRQVTPYHLLMDSPEMLVALVPAEIAPGVARHLADHYEREMGKVKGRLPLFLGLYFMDRHMPMFVALDAARRATEMAGELGKKDGAWEVCGSPVHDSAGGTYRLLLRPPAGANGLARPGVAWDIPGELGNGEPDFYHPYFLIEEPAAGAPAERRSSYIRTPAGPVVHVSELQEGDRLRIAPSHLDFLFLDSAARRFEVRLSEEHGTRPHAILGARRSPRPYLLEDLARMEQVWEWCWPPGMTGTQLRGIRDLLAARVQEWGLAGLELDSPEWQAYEGLIEYVLGKEFSAHVPGGAARAGLRQAMLDGLFFDCLELHLQILKDKEEYHE